MTEFNRINGVLQVEALESVDGIISLNEEQMQAIEDALASTDNLSTQLEEANNNATELSQSVEQLQGQVEELNKQITELKKEPGEKTATAIEKETEEVDIVQSARDLYENIPD